MAGVWCVLWCLGWLWHDGKPHSDQSHSIILTAGQWVTGGGRAPAVAHERAEKQDLGLDASSHFAGEGVLHSLTGLLIEQGGHRRAFVRLPLLSPPLELHSLSLFISFSFLGNVCSLTEQCGSWSGTGAPEKLEGLSGCWARGPLKGWNEKRGNMWPLFFPFSNQKSTFKCRNYTTLHF